MWSSKSKILRIIDIRFFTGILITYIKGGTPAQNFLEKGSAMTRATFVIFFTEVIKFYWLMLLLYPDELYMLLGASSFSLYICNVHIKTTFIRSHWKPFFHFILFETELHNVYWFGNFNDVFWRIVPFITVQKNTKKNNQNWNQLLHRRVFFDDEHCF